MVKNLPANVGNSDSIPGSRRFPRVGNGNLLQYSCLENSMDREVWCPTVHGVTRSMGHHWTRTIHTHRSVSYHYGDNHTLQYINMSDQHILHLKLIQCKMLLYLNGSYIKWKSLLFHHKRKLPTRYKNNKSFFPNWNVGKLNRKHLYEHETQKSHLCLATSSLPLTSSLLSISSKNSGFTSTIAIHIGIIWKGR